MATEVKATGERDPARKEKPDLGSLYKPVGIAAVSAAAICCDKSKRKTTRTSSRKM